MAPSFASLKSKAADAAGDLKSKTTSKPTQYKPVTPWDPEHRTSTPSSSERFQQSTVLQHQAAIHRPPPPPKRIHNHNSAEDGDTAPTPPMTATTSGAPPRLPYRGPSHSVASIAAASPPSLPARKSTGAAAPPPPPPPPRSNTSNSIAGHGSHAGRAVPSPPESAILPAYHSNANPSSPSHAYGAAAKTAAPPPAPPPRTSAAREIAEGLTSPSVVTPNAARAASFVPFSEYGVAEKQELFAMLDEFFEAKLKSSNATKSAQAANAASSVPRAATSPPTNIHAAPSTVIPVAVPPVTLRTRPPIIDKIANQRVPSYPPPQTHSSSALSLCHWIMYEPYPAPWYCDPSSPLPPPLQGRNDVWYSGFWMVSGSNTTVRGFGVFGDASCCWWSISFDTRSPTQVKREAHYRPIPSPWSGEQLYGAHEKYSEEIVAFARQAHSNGQPIARGECWDIAAEALNSITAPDEPFPSIGRTHGHLLYYGRAGESGIWRGGDSYVRPGDIVEWRLVTITQVDASWGSYSTLGDPDHTAVIVEVGEPRGNPPADGEAMSVNNLPNLTVVEQSQGKAPSLVTYDLEAMSKGEVWIYRPVPLVEFIGTEIKADWPPSCETWQVDQLE